MKSQTGLAMISGIIKPRDQELNKAMQAVFSVMREKYPHGVLIVKSTCANLFEAETESAFFNEKMMEEYLSDPESKILENIFSAVIKKE